MRTRVFMCIVGGLLAGAIAAAQTPAAGAAQAPSTGGSQTPTTGSAQTASTGGAETRLNFDGEIALWTIAVKADHSADFEKLMQRLNEGLKKIGTPERLRQAEGWKVVRLSPAMPDGTIAYMHMIHPVVPGVDYSVMRTLYEAFPEEQRALYDMYRAAFDRNVSLATGSIALDLGLAEPADPPASSEP